MTGPSIGGRKNEEVTAMRGKQLLIVAAVAIAACVGYDMFKARAGR
jgi:hypothetical protein